MKTSSKKRGRSKLSGSSPTSRSKSHPNEDSESGSSPSKRQKSNLAPLDGRTVAVSTLVNESDTGGEDDNYKNILALCKKAGAKTTGQVHKSVNYVVATKAAIAGRTQRVRKAWKRGIPVLDVLWVRDCLKAGNIIPYDPYLISEIDEDEKPRSERTNSVANLSAKDTDNLQHNKHEQIQVHVKEVDLGCCCSCHETGGEEDCEWCVDCKTA